MHHETELSEEMKAAFAAMPKRDEIPAEVWEALKRPDPRHPFGPTGKFPDGKLTEHDEGEIQFGVTTLKGKVVLNFGKPIASLGMDATQTRSLARLLLRYASKAESQAT